MLISDKAGKWLSRGPVGESAGINLYGYVLNNPIKLYDPLGMAPVQQGYGPTETQSGSAGLDTDGSGSAAQGEGTHQNQTSYDNPLNGDQTPYVAQNPNSSGAWNTSLLGSQVYVYDATTGQGTWAILGDDAKIANLQSGTLEVSVAVANALGIAQYKNGKLQNSVRQDKIIIYVYKLHKCGG